MARECTSHLPKTNQHSLPASIVENHGSIYRLHDRKESTRRNHVGDLRETFGNLRMYKLKLNPKKCIFGVLLGKFLGFIVDQRGMPANHKKI